MKEKATAAFKRSASGEVTGEIISERGKVVNFQSFGIMTEAEFERCLKLMQREFSDVDVIELTGN